MRYESYLKKIIIEPRHTEHCKDGCYLLITVKGANLREGFKQDEVIQDELDEESDEFKWIFETKEDENKCNCGK